MHLSEWKDSFGKWCGDRVSHGQGYNRPHCSHLLTQTTVVLIHFTTVSAALSIGLDKDMIHLAVYAGHVVVAVVRGGVGM